MTLPLHQPKLHGERSGRLCAICPGTVLEAPKPIAERDSYQTRAVAWMATMALPLWRQMLSYACNNDTGEIAEVTTFS